MEFVTQLLRLVNKMRKRQEDNIRMMKNIYNFCETSKNTNFNSQNIRFYPRIFSVDDDRNIFKEYMQRL